jgi:hypothetical protein
LHVKKNNSTAYDKIHITHTRNSKIRTRFM